MALAFVSGPMTLALAWLRRSRPCLESSIDNFGCRWRWCTYFGQKIQRVL